MNTTIARHVLSAIIAVLVATPVAAQNVLPLKRILLSTGGVGYFEHEAVVEGDVDLPLSVRLAQVDDVLKSIVVYDDPGGRRDDQPAGSRAAPAGLPQPAVLRRGAGVPGGAAQHVTVYRLKAPAQEGRVLLIDHPRHPDWQLAVPAEKDVELTRDRYRIRVTLLPGEERTVEAVVQRPRTDRVSLRDSPTATLAVYARTGSLDEKVRQALERLVTLRGDVDREERALAALEATRQAIHQEQERLRANLTVVPGAGELRQRYLEKLKKQEDDLETLEADIGAARTRTGAARDRLADAVGGANL